jgi:DNA-binding SARP family transcriptional activator
MVTLERVLDEYLSGAPSTAPRILSASAPPGYGKAEILRALGSRVGRLLVCDFESSGAADDLVRPILDALAADDAAAAVASAADRLAQRRQHAAGASRDALRARWPVETEPNLLLLRDPSGVIATPAGLDIMGELVAGLPPTRVLALATRYPLPRALQQLLASRPAQALGPEDLAWPFERVRERGLALGLSEQVTRRVYECAAGWPLVTRLMFDLIARDPSAEVLTAAASVSRDALLDFTAHRTFASLDEDVRSALVIAALFGRAAHIDLVRVLGAACDDALFGRLRSLPFVVPSGERIVVHPAVAALMRTRFAPLVRRWYDRTLSVLTGEGAYVQAAQIALEQHDAVRAAAIIDAAPPYTSAPVPLREYERIIERIDDDLVTQFPNVWIATIPYRTFAVDRATFVREAENVYFCLPPSAGADQRAAAIMLLSSAYANVGRGAESEALVAEALDGFARSNPRVRASLLNFAASLKGIDGRFTEARRLAHEAAELSRDAFGENQTLHYIEAHEAAYRGRYDRARVIFDELVRRRGREGLPLYLAHSATNAAFVAWVNGDDESFERYVDVLEDALTPGIRRGFAPIVDAARARPLHIDPGYPWPVVAAMAHLIRLGTLADRAEAVEVARAAAAAADERRDPYVQILAHVACYRLDAERRAIHGTALRAIAEPLESPELHEAVGAVLAGRPAGMLERFIRSRVVREQTRSTPSVVVELLGGRVVRDGAAVRLSVKEFEFLALLASAQVPLSRARIGEALWDHLDPEEWPNNLKVTLSRTRAKIGTRDCVALVDGRYRLAPAIDVDLRRTEDALRLADADGRLGHDAAALLAASFAAFSRGSADRFERYAWAQSLLARLNDAGCAAGIALARDALARGAHSDALSYARAVSAIDPLNEDACEAALRALVSSGQTDAARREFRRYASALRDELDAEPPARLAELARLL